MYDENASITDKLEWAIELMRSEAEHAERHMGWREEDGQESIFEHFYEYAQDKGYSDAMKKAIFVVQRILDEECHDECD